MLDLQWNMKYNNLRSLSGFKHFELPLVAKLVQHTDMATLEQSLSQDFKLLAQYWWPQTYLKQKPHVSI